MLERLKTYWQRVKQAGQRSCQKSFSKLQDQWQGVRHQRQLKKTPIYLLVGASKSGKAQFIRNSGLRFLQPEHYGREAMSLVGQFEAFDWYFSEELIVVDIAQDEPSKSALIEKRLLKYLRTQRRHKPLAGVLYTFSLPELILATHQKRREALTQFAEQIQYFYRLLKTVIPVYTILTKTDLIRGFSEFFSDMSKEELSQVWGVTFPLESCHDVNALVPFFLSEYSHLMARLQQRVLWNLDAEKKQRGRDLIYAFPQQMQLLRQPMVTFIQELFSGLSGKQVLQFRGIYFTSAEQRGEPYDFFLHAIARRFNIKSDYRVAQEPHQESYFIHGLFYEVLLKEYSVVGFSERAQHVKRWFYRSAWVMSPILLLCSFWLLHSADNANQVAVSRISNAVNQYHLAVKNLPPDDSAIAHSLPILNTLTQIQSFYQQQSGLAKILWPIHQIHSASAHALNRSLHVYFLPRVAAKLESLLQKGTSDTNILYANLKGYLAFSPSDYTEPTAIQAPMEIEWEHRYQENSSLREQLHYYLRLSSQMRLDQLPLDRPLINRVRQSLQQVVPSQRAYALLMIKALASHLSNIHFRGVIGADFPVVFAERKPELEINALYTKAGYETIFLKNYQSVAEQVSNDNREIGLDAHADSTESYSQIIREIQRDYNKAYQKAWDASLTNLSIQSFHSFRQADTILTLLSSDHSPLKKLLNLVDDNTQSISGERITVHRYYDSLNDFSQSAIMKSKLTKVTEDFAQLKQFLMHIHASADVNQAALQAALDYMKGNANNPIRQISVLAEESPQPVRAWLKAVADNSWQLILKHALAKINAQWRMRVISEYDTHIRGRYPLNLASKNQLDMVSFSHFFAPSGTLSHFFNHYLKVFVDTSKVHWSLYQLNGHSLPLSSQAIVVFRRLKEIQDLYFDQNTHQPRVRFSLEPVMLDRHASAVTLYMGTHSIQYRHGPQRPVAITWPLDEANQETKLVISDFSGHKQVYANYGPWSIFHWFRQTNLRASSDGAYQLSIRLGGHYASFRMISSAPLATFKLDGMRGFTLPKNL